MTRALLRLSLLILTLVVLAPPPAARAQGLASLAVATTSATTGSGASTALVEKAGCWDCTIFVQVYKCTGGQVPGYWNCNVSWSGCNRSGAGCGGSASVPVDLDGAAQYVSRAVMRLQAGDPTIQPVAEDRNCDGVLVARLQSPDNIAAVRTSTAALSL
jgi:hypothetical protein